MNEELLCAAIFEQAVIDYVKAKRFLRNPHGKNKKEIERDIKSAKWRVKEIRQFADGKEAMLYSGGSDRVIAALKTRLDEIDNQYNVLRK